MQLPKAVPTAYGQTPDNAVEFRLTQQQIADALREYVTRHFHLEGTIISSTTHFYAENNHLYAVQHVWDGPLAPAGEKEKAAAQDGARGLPS